MKKLLVLLPLLGGGTTVVAQTNFRPGYVIPLSGDTLRGEVDARGAQRNARLARFRPEQGGAIIEYQPRQLRGYGLTGDRVYQTETVALSDSVERPALVNVPATAVRRPSFLEVIVQGPASLLYLRDEANKDHYYLRMAGGVPEELLQTTRQVVENGVTYQKKSDEFRYTLAAATKQCLAIQPAINTIRFGQNELALIVQRYNECVGAVSVTPASATRKTHIQLGVVAGGEKSQLTLDDYPDLTAKGTSSTSPVIGLAANIRLMGVSRTISARIEALYEKQSYELETGSNSRLARTYRATLESIRFPLQVRYTYPKGAIRPFLYAGYSFSTFLTNSNEVKGSYSWAPWIQKPRNLEQGILGGVGLTTARASGRNLAIDLRYERSDGFTEAKGFGSRVSRYYLLLSYDLTK